MGRHVPGCSSQKGMEGGGDGRVIILGELSVNGSESLSDRQRGRKEEPYFKGARRSGQGKAME